MSDKNEKISEELSEFLKLQRFKSKLSQEDVAKMLSISRNSYNQYENYPLKMTLEILLKLSIIYNINLYNFFYSQCCNTQPTKQEN